MIVDLFIASVRKLNCSASTFEFPLFNARDIPSSKEAKSCCNSFPCPTQ